ncbi:hypothetical protein [Singulisphaera sp. PoT]|uniref:hypothetical protein n=1 Tax=Singulisphaera sp. PoT TaxID=3411797 RepID=UPI003BF5659D
MISIHPISMGLSIYTLYLLLSSKGKVVFSPEYREVIKLTPHVFYRTSLLVKILVTLLAVVLVLMIIGGIFTIMKT